MSEMIEPKKKARKVVHLTSVHPPFDVRIFHKECKSIARAGYNVTLIAGHERDETVDGVRVKGVSRSSNRLSRMLSATWAIGRQALHEDADLYHFHDPELIPLGVFMRFRKKKVVYDVHEDVPADVAFKHYIPRPLRRPLAWLAGLIEMKSSRYFSAIVPATPAISRRFRFRPGDTVVVSNYPLLDDRSFNNRLPWAQRSPSIVYVGLLSKNRCIGEILQAMALVPKSLEATLVLAGIFSPPAYAQEVAASEAWPRVKALGFIDHTQVAQLLNEACAGLCICRSDPNYVEAFPTKIFEYMSAGIPVIASDLPEIRAIVSTTKCGLLVNHLDPKSIAQAIEYVLNHPQEAEQMGQRGREAVLNKFNWANEESKLLALYEELFDPRSAA